MQLIRKISACPVLVERGEVAEFAGFLKSGPPMIVGASCPYRMPTPCESADLAHQLALEEIWQGADPA
jgi:hypothetical protein